MKHALALIAIAFAASSVLAADLTTTDGRTYKDVKAIAAKSNNTGVYVEHATGAAFIPYDNMTDDDRVKYGFDPQAEKARLEEAARRKAKIAEEARLKAEQGTAPAGKTQPGAVGFKDYVLGSSSAQVLADKRFTLAEEIPELGFSVFRLNGKQNLTMANGKVTEFSLEYSRGRLVYIDVAASSDYAVTVDALIEKYGKPTPEQKRPGVFVFKTSKTTAWSIGDTKIVAESFGFGVPTRVTYFGSAGTVTRSTVAEHKRKKAATAAAKDL